MIHAGTKSRSHTVCKLSGCAFKFDLECTAALFDHLLNGLHKDLCVQGSLSHIALVFHHATIRKPRISTCQPFDLEAHNTLNYHRESVLLSDHLHNFCQCSNR